MKNTNWYAVFTASRAEKRVKERLEQAGIENYLPVRAVERWAKEKIGNSCDYGVYFCPCF